MVGRGELITMASVVTVGSRIGPSGREVLACLGASISSSSSKEGIVGAMGVSGGTESSIMQPGKRGEVLESHHSMNLMW